MKIYIVVKERAKNTNRFIDELRSILREIGHSVQLGLDLLWKDDVFLFDIIYFQWPEYVLDGKITPSYLCLLRNRMEEIRKRGIKIFSHCHNLVPHVVHDANVLKVFDIIYGESDVMIHMGMYSQAFMQEKYPSVQHYVIPHLVYKAFDFDKDQIECKKKLNLPLNKINILCFGQFRNKDERFFILALKNILSTNRYNIITPGFYRARLIRKNVIKSFIDCFWMMYYKMKGVKFSHKLLDEKITEEYFVASDIVMIQRPKILNSGNLPMAYSAGKVVLGPCVGNVGLILEETQNPIFNPQDMTSVVSAIEKAVQLSEKGKGKENKEYAEMYWSHEAIGKLYNDLIKRIFNNYENRSCDRFRS